MVGVNPDDSRAGSGHAAVMRPRSVVVGGALLALVTAGCGGSAKEAASTSAVSTSTAIAPAVSATTAPTATVPVATGPSLPPGTTLPGGAPLPAGASRIGRLSPADGVVTWQSPVDGLVLPLPVAITSSVVAAVVCSGDNRLRVQAFDLATGAEGWRRELGGCEALVGQVVAAGETIVVVQGASVLGLDAATGAERWATPVSAGFVQVGANADAVVVAAEREVIGLDAGSGTERWRVEGPSGGSMWPPVLAGGSAILGGSDQAGGQPSSTLHALDAATGQLRWRQPAGGMIAPPAAVIGELIVVQLFPDAGLRHVGTRRPACRPVPPLPSTWRPVPSDGACPIRASRSVQWPPTRSPAPS